MSRRILVPVDFSEFSLRALEKGLELAGDSSELILLHVYEPPRLARPDLIAWGEIDGKMMPLAQIVKEESKHKLTALLSEVKPRTSARLRILVAEGRAAAKIVETAESEDCDMIVMGTHGTTGFKHLVLGSVTEAVVRTARCPVLSVPPRQG